MAGATLVGHQAFPASNATSWSLTTTADAHAGETLVVALSNPEYSDGATTFSVTDPNGSSYTLRGSQAYFGGGAVRTWDTVLAADIPSGSTITVTMTGYGGTPPTRRQDLLAATLQGVGAFDGNALVATPPFFTANGTFQVNYIVSPVPQLMIGLVGGYNLGGGGVPAWAMPGSWGALSSPNLWAAYLTSTVADGGTENYTGAVTYSGSGADAFAGVILGYRINARLAMSTVQTRTRRRVRAYIDSAGALKVDRYNDAVPPAIAATVTIETSGCTGCSLVQRGDGPLDLVYVTGGTVYERRSRDRGRSFGVADTIATGYQDVLSAVHRHRGVKIVLLFKESEGKWYGTVGRQAAGGPGWDYPTSPAVVLTNAKAGGSLLLRRDGVAEFDYNTAAGGQATVRCRKYSVADPGTWS